MSDFDKIVSGMFALFVGVIMFIVVLPTMLTTMGQSPIIAYILGFGLFLVIFIGFIKILTE